MLLVIDNYDSFTYNLVQYFGELGATLLVKRNDEITLDEIAKLNPERICISPGPCTPAEAGISSDVIRRFAPDRPILGVCLGHQCMGHVYGGDVVRADRLMHGKTSMIHHDGKGLLSRMVSRQIHQILTKLVSGRHSADGIDPTESMLQLDLRHDHGG